ncbi:MAG: isopenicillin N synthase family oxygenase [Scytonematopsis contorta HA4267-MV1]|nr:isopenicillin N synthase family oxygenase [Scytonematopsis contorta HA4267-MV1]
MVNQSNIHSVQVPVIDFAPFWDGNYDSQLKVAQEIARACCEVGFFYLKNHGVSQDILQKAFAQCKNFFALPLQIKQQIPIEAGSRGYEKLESQTFDPNKAGDLKETFLCCRELDPSDLKALEGHSYAVLATQPNKWLPEYPEFREVSLQLIDACTQVTQKVLQAFALALDLPENYFTNLHTTQNYIMRFLHYPALQEAPKPGQPRLGAHTDWGSVTLLFQDEAEGLEICTNWGEWVAAPPIPETILVNTGDLMQLWTNDRFRSTKHRVAVPSDFTTAKERYSIVCFGIPNYDAEISCIPSCVDVDSPLKYEPVVVGDYYMQKIRETFY